MFDAGFVRNKISLKPQSLLQSDATKQCLSGSLWMADLCEQLQRGKYDNQILENFGLLADTQKCLQFGAPHRTAVPFQFVMKKGWNVNSLYSVYLSKRGFCKKLKTHNSSLLSRQADIVTQCNKFLGRRQQNGCPCQQRHPIRGLSSFLLSPCLFFPFSNMHSFSLSIKSFIAVEIIQWHSVFGSRINLIHFALSIKKLSA